MKNISVSVIILSLFLITSFVSFDKLFGSAFIGLPFKLAVLSVIAHLFSFFRGKKKLFNFTFSNISLLLLLVIAVIYTFFISWDYQRSFEIWDNYSKCIVLYFLIANLITTKEEFYLFALAITFVGIYIGYDFVHHPTWHNGRAFYQGSNMVGDPNGISMLMVYSIPFAAISFLVTKNKYFKWMIVPASFYMGLAIVEMQSRGAFLGLLSLSIFTFFNIPKEKRLVSGIVGALVLGLFVVRYVPADYFMRIREIANPNEDVTGSAQTRLQTMIFATQYILSHPFSEYGLGNHSYYIGAEYGWEMSEGDDNIFKGSFLAHCIFLQYGADTGLVPLLVFLVFIGSIIQLLHKNLKKCKGDRMLTIYTKGTIISLVSFFCGAFFLPWAYRIFPFIICGIAASLSNLLTLGKSENKTDDRAHSKHSSSAIKRKYRPPIKR